MLIIAASEFRKKQKKYFELALTQAVGVKSGDVIFEITPSKEIFVNPSPSGDPYFDDPCTVEEINKRIADYKSGKSEVNSYSAEKFKKRFGV